MTTYIRPFRHWECPNCTATHITYEAEPHTAFHICKGLKGMTAPFVPAGTKCKVEAHEREDWVNDELVQTNGEGRPIMSVVTTRDDGQDCAVFPATAQLRGEAAPECEQPISEIFGRANIDRWERRKV
jgi:hypothetical protein